MIPFDATLAVASGPGIEKASGVFREASLTFGHSTELPILSNGNIRLPDSLIRSHPRGNNLTGWSRLQGLETGRFGPFNRIGKTVALFVGKADGRRGDA